MTLSYKINKINYCTLLLVNSWFYIILSYITLLYNFNSLIWLTSLVEYVSTCSRQPKLLTCWKNTQLIITILYYLHVLTGSQINKKQFNNTPCPITLPSRHHLYIIHLYLQIALRGIATDKQKSHS